MSRPPVAARLARLHLLSLMCGAVVFLPGTASPAQPAGQASRGEAGRIDIVEGRVTVTGADGASREPRAGEILREGDLIMTADDGELHADMLDGGVIAVRPATRLRVVRYRAAGEPTDACLFNLAKGSFRSITGWIATRNPAGYRIQAGTATIGVRGTDHEPMVVLPGTPGIEAGTYDRVHTGTTRIRGPGGTVDVGQGRAGFHAVRRGAGPRLLQDVPAHFRAGRHDHLLEGRHERVRQSLEARHAERRARLEERRRERASRRVP